MNLGRCRYPRALPKPRTEAMRQTGLQALKELRNKLMGRT